MSGDSGSLFGDEELPIALRPPQAFRRLPQRLDVDYTCPRCSYGWSGKPKPTGEDAAADVESE